MWGGVLEEGTEEFLLAERILRGGDRGQQRILAGVRLAVTQQLRRRLGHLGRGKTGSGTPKTHLEFPKTHLEFPEILPEFLNPSPTPNLYPRSTP